MDYSREKLIEIWQRAAPGTPPPELFDTLLYSDGQADVSDGALSLCSDLKSDAKRASGAPAPTAFSPALPAPAPSTAAPTPSPGPTTCERLRGAVEGELCLFALYRALARHSRSRRLRGLAREFDRLSADAYAAARSAAGACYLACGDYAFGEPECPPFDSLRDGIRKAWTVERSLAKLYAEFSAEIGGDMLMRICSAHSTKLRELLEASF